MDNPRPLMRHLSVLAFVALSGLGTVVGADSVSTSSRMALFQSQTAILDGRASEQYSDSVRLQPEEFRVPTLNGPEFLGSYSGPYLQMARSAASRYGIPSGLFLRLVQQESGWNPRAVSPKGAIGLAQLMPQTARVLGVDPHNPAENLEGGARYLRQQYDRFGNWRLALAAYNAGPEAVERHGGVPPYRETRNYVRVIYGS
jgi:soluble lytic murein transglycosylase-like protein